MAQRNNTYYGLDTHKINVSGIIYFLVLFFLFVDKNEHTAHRQIYTMVTPNHFYRATTVDVVHQSFSALQYVQNKDLSLF